MDCGISNEKLNIEKVVNKKFKFSIVFEGEETGEIADEKIVMDGRITGTATLIKANMAVFKNKIAE